MDAEFFRIHLFVNKLKFNDKQLCIMNYALK